MGNKGLVLIGILAMYLGILVGNVHAEQNHEELNHEELSCKEQKVKLFGPEVYKRTTGNAQNRYNATIRIPSYVKPEFTILVQNGHSREGHRDPYAVTSGSVWLNGHKVIGEDKFNKRDGVIEGKISFEGHHSSLQSLNLEVRISGAPGTYITVTLYGKMHVGEMHTARFDHKAVLLPDGKVLISGGKNRRETFASVERFDPATNRFQRLNSSLNSPRSGHSATILPSGKVLHAGGQDHGGNLGSAELFDIASAQFSVLSESLKTSRAGHTATLLSDGTILVVGGRDMSHRPLASSEVFGSKIAQIFDPRTGEFTELTSNLNVARAYHSATLLPDGKVLIAGGDAGDGALDSAELFDPDAKIFTLLEHKLATARSRHASVLYPDGKVLLIGGQNSTGKEEREKGEKDYKDRKRHDRSLKTAEAYDPATGLFTPMNETLHERRTGHTATLLVNGMVLVTGGQVEAGEGEAEDDTEFFGGIFTSANPPQVASISPADKALAVNVNSFVSVRFSEPVDVTTVNSAALVIKDDAGNLVAGSVIPAEGGLLAFFLPAMPLSQGVTYTVSLATSVKGISGSPLQPFTSTFRTSAPPVLNDFAPVAGRPGKPVVIHGKYFYPDLASNRVWFNTAEATVTAATATALTVTVPKGATSGPLTVTTPEGSATSAQSFTVLPDSSVIKNILPAGATNGDTVQIVGDYFSEVPSENVVSFAGSNNSIIPAIPTASTTKSLTVVIPDNAVTGPVKVTIKGEASNSFSYVISPPRDFTLAMVPDNAQVGQGSRATYLVAVAPKGNFAELVSLAASGLPAGAVATFEPARVAPGQKSLLTVSVAPTTPINVTSLTITGTAAIGDRMLTHSAIANLKVLDGKGTSFGGKVFDIDGNPLKGVTASIGSLTTLTDDTGQFLLLNVPVGDQILIIDGTSANTSTIAYPVVPFTVNIVPNTANVFKQTAYLHRINKDHVTPIVYPNEVLATDPRIPDFVLRIPAGTSIKDWKGNQVDKVSVMQVPIDRLAVNALPAGVSPRVVYMFSFDRWGGATPSRPIPVIFPNDIDALPSEQVDLWYYDESPNLGESPNDWRIFGTGTVSPDGLRIISDPGVGIPKFCCGASFVSPRTSEPTPSPDPPEPPDPPTPQDPQDPPSPPEDSDRNCSDCGSNSAGDPVDTATGLFTLSKTDIFVPGRTPLLLKRHYNSAGTRVGAFGLGFTTNYDAGILTQRTGDSNVIYYFSPGGSRYRMVKQSDGSFVALNDHALTKVKVYLTTDGAEMRYPDGKICTFKSAGEMAWLVESKIKNGNFMRFDRDASGRVTKVSTSDGIWLGFGIDSATGLVSSVWDHSGRRVSYAYDSSNRLVSVADPAGGITSYTYDSSNRLESITDTRGIKYLVNEYDNDGRVRKQAQADGTNFFFEYGLSGRTVTAARVTNPNGSAFNRRFSSRGYKMAEVDSLGQKTVFERDYTNSRILSVTDPLYRVTRFTYDELGSVTSVLRPMDNITLIEYDSVFHKPNKITDSLNRTINFTYDVNGKVITATDPAGNTFTYTYNQKGLLDAVTNPLGNTTTYHYDDRGNVISATDPLGSKELKEYDPLNRAIAITNGNGKSTTYAYDNWNRIIAKTDPAGNKTSYTYDGNGNLLTVTDAKGQKLIFEYDSMDRVTSKTDSIGHIEAYTYDAGGNLATKTDSKGQITTYSYDAAGHLTQIAYADGSSIDYVYDVSGRVSAIKDSVSGTISFTYDQLDRVIQEITPTGAVQYEYDILGRRTAMIACGQEKVAYGYDQRGNLITVTQGTTAVTLTYDKLGRRTGITYPNNVATAYNWDAAGKLVNLNHTAIASTIESIGLSYDGAGNIIMKSRAQGTEPLPPAVTNTVAQGNQITAAVKGAENITYTYDANGNLTSSTNTKGTITYTWDARNRLVAINGPAVTASFRYDALGRRIEKTVNGKTTTFRYDGLDIIQEQESGAIKANYLRTLRIDEVLARTDANGIRFYQHDHLGSTVALTDENGITKTVYSYEPYGNTTITGELIDQPFQYTGRENDGTGLYYYRARYYSPEMQKFISQDPIGLAGGDVNFYAYVLNNPVNRTDPTGLFFGWDDAAVIGAWFGLGAIGAGFYEWWRWVTHPPPPPPQQFEWRTCPKREPKFASRPRPTVTAPPPPPPLSVR